MKGVAAIILCHNHPSGDPSPSVDDIALTKRLADAGRTLGIGVLDHIIIGKPGHSLSFCDQGLGSRLRETLFHISGTQWQYHTESIPASLRRKKAPKENKGGEAVAVAAQP